MQLIDWIILGLIVAAVLVLLFLLSRKWKQLLLLDLAAMPKAKLRSKKYQLIEGRLQRRASSVFEVVRQLLAPATKVIQEQSKRLYESIVALERKYHLDELMPQNQKDKEKTRVKIAQMLEAGAALFKEEKYTDAEQLFLDIIRINDREVQAYEYLGEIYMQRREFDHAIETLEFAKQLSPEDDRISFDLATIYQTRGELERAKRYLTEAVELAPTNPKNIDALLRLAIDMKDLPVARDMLKAMKDVNPENQKIEELQASIKEIEKELLVKPGQ